MNKVTMLLDWLTELRLKVEPKPKPKSPISFNEQVCLFTKKPILHRQFTPRLLQQSIQELQAILQSKGLLTTLSGEFDEETENAVKRFQEQNNLYADGIVAPITWAALHYPTLRRNNESESTQELQEAIGTLQTALNTERFYVGDLFGTFGDGTKRAVKRFQGTYGLRADGIVGPLTWAVLLGMREQPKESFLVAVFPSYAELLRLWQQILMVAFTLLGITCSPHLLPNGLHLSLPIALGAAIALTCVMPFVLERLSLKQPVETSLPLLRYAPYVLVGILASPIFHALRTLIEKK